MSAGLRPFLIALPPGSTDTQLDVIPIQDRALVKSELIEIDVVIGQRLDFVGAPGGQGLLGLEHEEAGVFTVFQLGLFSPKRLLGVDPCLTSGIDLEEVGPNFRDVVIDGGDDR